MNEAVVYLDMCRVPLEKDVFSFSMVAEDQECGFSREELEKTLPEFFENFKAKDLERVRYVIVFSPGDAKGLSLLEITRTIDDLHKRIILLPFEAEAFILLPRVSAEPSAKARCLEFFNTLKKTNPVEQPDLIWLIDRNRLPPTLFSKVLLNYLSTDVYRSFNGQIMLKRFDIKETCVYGSMGLSRMVFSVNEWRRYLSLMLARDILNTPPLTPLAKRPDTAEMALSQVFPFLAATLQKLADELKKDVTFSKADDLLESFYMEKIQGITELLDRLEIMIQQEAGRRWEAALQKAEEFTRQVKDEFIKVLDHAPHGPYSARGFIGLLMQSSGPYVEFFQDPESCPEDLKATSIQGYLFGWQVKEPSPVLNLLFKEATNELHFLYRKRGFSFPELRTWPALLTELDRLLAIKDIHKILGQDKDFISDLRKAIEQVVQNGINPFIRPFSSSDLRSFTDLLVHNDRRSLADAIKAMQTICQEIRNVEDQIRSLEWWKLPFFCWHLFLKKRKLKKNLRNTKENVRQAYLNVVNRCKRLFPCYYAAYMVDEIFALLNPLETKIKEFCSHLEDTLDILSQEIMSGKPVAPPLSFSAVENDKEITSLYHKEILPEHLPALFPEFLEVFKTKKLPRPKLSDFYESSEKRRMFMDGLREYTAGKFSWILDWDVARVITFLKKGKRTGRNLALKAAPFLRTKTDSSEEIRNGLFLGLCNTERSPFEAASFESPTPVYFSNQDPEVITALTLYHGFPASSIEGWDDWKACAESGDNKKSS